MGYADIQTKLIARLQTITELKNIKAYPRRTIFPDEFEEVFGFSLNNVTSIHAWLIIWNGAKPTRAGVPLGTLWVNHTFTILGYLNWTSNSEQLIRSYAEQVMTSLATYLTLGLPDGITYPTIVQDVTISIDGFRREPLSDVLCSVATITVSVKEYKAPVTFS
jgi:hypothetical protein